MKQTQLDKHTIAWFKIAEYVSRGEKERALGVYRLLSHSFNDVAVARQLEADIYLAFDEKNTAISLYYQAMELYQKSQRLLEAVAVCEHLITMNPHDVSLRREAIKLYHGLHNEMKLYEHIERSLDMLVISHDYVLQEFLSMLQQYSSELYEYGCLYVQKIDK
jgi:tetratricopeptide (TPR) repeat protein